VKLWPRRRELPATEYPATIPGRLTLRTGDQIPLVAHLTDEIDDHGIRRYEIRLTDGSDRLPITEADFLAGGYGLGVDLVPGLSSMTWRFTEEAPPPA
jgi:hypothetical protein